jgi:hypothetical protein
VDLNPQEDSIYEFARELRILINRFKLNFAEVQRALSLLDQEAEEARRKALMNKA